MDQSQIPYGRCERCSHDKYPWVQQRMGPVGDKRQSGLLMSKNLLLVFTKNIELGKVKTRLAKSIGDEATLNVYKQLVDITERESLERAKQICSG